ncbi:hypothetical protein D9757_005246 [Collybiopsis confluens]|uniref:DUF6830 domain-containing protein n=1 Tax=Collybiopsis confluens TaxID=2823264 RepID=A0A8H5HVT0_9AGAR|nr:hypothetical protein D9757_005246 [Collybiopsis confluens]
MWGATRPKKNLFIAAINLQNNLIALNPFRSFLSNRGHTAFHLIQQPDLKSHSVLEAQAVFQLPDFSGALEDYFTRARLGISTFTIAGRRSASHTHEFPFKVHVWSKVAIQGRQFHNLLLPNDIRTIFATPPSPDSQWKFGRNDCVLLNIDDEKEWPHSSLEGHCVAIVKMIFSLSYPANHANRPGADRFLAYCERFDTVNQPPPPQQYAHLPCYQAWKLYYPDYFSGCYVLRKALRSSGAPFGDVIPISQFRAQVAVAPRLRNTADIHLTPYNVMTYASEYLLNKFWDKELWYAFENADPCSSPAL